MLYYRHQMFVAFLKFVFLSNHPNGKLVDWSISIRILRYCFSKITYSVIPKTILDSRDLSGTVYII